MENKKTIKTLLPIPTKRYFTIGEVGTLCGVKPHVLRYWEQEFAQLRPVKRRGNRRYYQQQEVLLIHRIRELLYEQGFTINGARNHLEQNESKPVLTNESMNTSLFPVSSFGHIRQEINNIVSQLRS
ncbi:MerR family transcriptional regulator [Nitrosomonas sp. sh817]|jgi:DNA-binding transcriptional MerR regulator|uniref:MerR family transcriptional regulator n=1 Tax=Nitrosomonas sp. sh817 TaxID=3070658 RepID=UPI0027DD2E56|nr:MerR family transcriptional regulator [Nitrosomonas sp. sh817]WMJ07653.1 MerR family transcriptional regulator [Nitrosomonas sp. sh817]